MHPTNDTIATLLNCLRNQFYGDRIREFKRDQTALVRALCTYGYECHRRGWNFDDRFIFRELMNLLRQIKTSRADVRYLPVYLAGAIRRAIGQRAEELNAQAKAIPPKVAKIVSGLARVTAVREPSAAEALAGIYFRMNRRRWKKNSSTKQLKLL